MPLFELYPTCIYSPTHTHICGRNLQNNAINRPIFIMGREEEYDGKTETYDNWHKERVKYFRCSNAEIILTFLFLFVPIYIFDPHTYPCMYDMYICVYIRVQLMWATRQWHIDWRTCEELVVWLFSTLYCTHHFSLCFLFVKRIVWTDVFSA